MKRGSAFLGVVLALVLAGPAQARENSCHDFNGNDVLLVGDSHTFIPGCGAYQGWDADARVGRNSMDGLSVVATFMAPRHDQVVFDLATNDIGNPTLYRSNLRTLWALIGSRDLTLVTSYVPYQGGNLAKPVNDEIRDFEGNHPQRVDVVDWAGYARSHGFVPVDGVHFSLAQYEQRVDLVLEAGCCSRHR